MLPLATPTTYPHLTIASCGVYNRGYQDSNGGDSLFGITFWY
jgi:hypothetical protein